MSINPIRNANTQALAGPQLNEPPGKSPVDDARHVRDVFRDFVGETFYRQMLKSMRETVDKPAYFYGGRGEEVFTKQLDETLAQTLTKANGSAFADGMFAHAFPNLAAVLKDADATAAPHTELNRQAVQLHDLTALPRR